MLFPAQIRLLSINPYILVSPARAAALKPNWRKPLPVLVRINGSPEQQWRINLMPKGDGSFYLYLHGDVRKASKTKVGDRVKVELQFDKAYRNGPQHGMPADFRKALGKSKTAKKNWDALAPSRKKEVLRMFARLKAPETKQRNLAKAMEMLRGKAGRFMARDWKNGA